MKPFWILGHPRAGSHLLGDHLNQTGLVQPTIHEWLNMFQDRLPIPKWMPWWGPFQKFELDYDTLVYNLPPYASVHWPHYSNFFTLEDKPVIERNLPELKYIQLRRRDVIATTVSRYIARLSLQWVLRSEEAREEHNKTEVPIIKKRLFQMYHVTVPMFKVWDEYLEGSEFLEVIYEDMVVDLQGILERVFEYLEMPMRPNASNSRIYKTAHPARDQLYQILEEAIASGEVDEFKVGPEHSPLVPLL